MKHATLATLGADAILGTGEREAMAKKRSESRRHTGMIRVDSNILEQAKLAASMMRMSLADYATDVLSKAADRDIKREATKLAGGGKP